MQQHTARPLWMGIALAFAAALALLAIPWRRRQLQRVEAAPRGGPPRARMMRRMMAGAALVAGLVLIACGAGYAALRDRQQARATAIALTGGNPDHAPYLMVRYGCAGCHLIPGCRQRRGRWGPSLKGVKDRLFLGGAVRTSPQRLVDWIVDPHEFEPGSAMPRTGISKAEARDVAAFLYVLP